MKASRFMQCGSLYVMIATVTDILKSLKNATHAMVKDIRLKKNASVMIAVVPTLLKMLEMLNGVMVLTISA